MKNVIIRSVVLTAIFFVSFFTISSAMNSTNIDLTGTMEPCTFPAITAVCEGRQVNRMFGSKEEMSATYMRDTVTPLDAQGKMLLRIDTYGRGLEGISYEVRSLDAERLIENTKLTEWEKEQRIVEVTLNIQDLLQAEEEYLLIIRLSTKEQEEIYYYTRITKNQELNIQEKMSFVLDFHDRTFQKDSEKELVKYLESNSSGDNTDFHYVNINSSYEHVLWGKLDVKQSGETLIQIQELNNQTGVFLLHYQVTLENDAGEVERYNVKEYYRIRYTKDRVYLLNFERTMDQVFRQENAVYYSTAIQLGIVDKDTQYMTNEEETIVSFVQAGELFSYDRAANRISKVFGFMSSNVDVREQNDEHEIKIIKVNKDGDMDFIVYGYMNRGQHEGETGVSVCHYEAETNSVQEYVFIESKKSFGHLRQDVGQLAYIGNKKTLYIHLMGSIYKIHTESRKTELLVENIRDNTFVTSEDNRFVAWQKEQKPFDSAAVILMNLETGQQRVINAGENERIRPLGFMGTDFIYGIADVSQIVTDVAGNVIFPMKRVIIENKNGEIQKEYAPAGFFVTSVEISENMIRLTRVTDNDGTHNYMQGAEDQIVNSSKEEGAGVVIASTVTEKKKRQHQIEFGKELKSGTPKCLYPKEIISGEDNRVRLPDNTKEESCFYVYTHGKLESMYTSAAQAVAEAYESAGVVVTENQKCIWERTRSKVKTQIMDVITVASTDNINSAAACASAILSRSGIQIDASAELSSGATVQELLAEQLGKENLVNLTGVSMENVLYCISRGYPVLAMIDSTNYVIITGYNELNTIVMNPQTQKTGYVGMNDSKAMFEAAGNAFWAITK